MLRCIGMAPDKPVPSTSLTDNTATAEPELGPVSGPRRRAPAFYAGETYGRHIIQFPDVARHANGAVASKRDKQARRLIRGALKRRFSRVESAMKLPRAMQAQAREIIRDAPATRIDDTTGRTLRIGKSPRAAHRLFASELAIHEPVYVPADLRALRTAKRKLKRQGRLDAIGQLVDRMSR